MTGQPRPRVVALFVFCALAATVGTTMAQTPSPVWQQQTIAQGPAVCAPGTTGTTMAGFDHDPAGQPVVAWREDCGTGARPRLFWSRRTGADWSTHEFISDRRWQGGGAADEAHTLVVMPLDGKPVLVYSAPGIYNEINTYRVDLDASLNGGPVSTYLETLAWPQSGGTANYSATAGALAAAASWPQWATGFYLSNDFGHVQINGTTITTSLVYRPRVSFTVAPDGGQHLLWGTETQIFYTRKLPGDLLFRTESFLLGLEHFGGEFRIAADNQGVLHGLVRGYDPDYFGDGGTIAYFRSTDSGQTWTGPEYVDPWDAVRSNPGVHTDIALAVDANGTPAVTYWKYGRQLWFSERDASGTWTRSLVSERTGTNGRRAALVDFDADGYPSVAYWDQPSGRVIYATQQPPNRPPTIAATLPAWSLFEGEAVDLTLDRLVTASDPDGDDLTYTVTGLPAGLLFDADAGAITGAAGAGSVGDYTITVEVTDPGGETASATFRFSVTTRPALRSVTTMSLSTGSTSPGAPIQLQVWVASESPTSQVPGGTVVIRQEPAMVVLARLTLDGSGQAARTIVAPGYGEHRLVAVYEGDAAFLPSEMEVPLVVIDPALRPEIRPLANRTDAPGTFVGIPIEVHSPAHRGLTVTLSGAPVDAFYRETEDREIIALPLTGASRGVHTVVVTVSDGLQSTSTAFVWTVQGNRPPTILMPEFPRLFPGDSVSLTITVVDPDYDQVRAEVLFLPPGLTYDPVTRRISGTYLGGADPLWDVFVGALDGYWTVGMYINLRYGSLINMNLGAGLTVAPAHAGDRNRRGVLTLSPRMVSRQSVYGQESAHMHYRVQIPSGAVFRGIESGRWEGYPPPSCVPTSPFELACTHIVSVTDEVRDYPARLHLELPATSDALTWQAEVVIDETYQRDPDTTDNLASGVVITPVLPATGRKAMVIVVEHNDDQLQSVSWSGLHRAASSAVAMTLADIGVPDHVTSRVQSVADLVYQGARTALTAATRSLVNRMKSHIIENNPATAGCYADMLSSFVNDPELATQHPIIAFNDRYGEHWVADCLEQMAAPYYDHVETLTDAEASFVNFKATVERLHDEGYEIDLLLDVHGCGTPSTRNNLFCEPNPWLLFSDGPAYRDGVVDGSGRDETTRPTLQSINSFFNGSVRNPDGTPAPAAPGWVRLNAVYMVSCWGSNENQMWLDMGANASNGAEELNYMVIISPFTFLDQFTRNGASLDEAARRAYEDERVLFEGLPASFTVDFSMVPGCGACRYTADLGAVYRRRMALALSNEWGADKEQPVAPLESSRRVGIVSVPVALEDEAIYVTDPRTGARLAIVVPTAITGAGAMTLQTGLLGPPIDVHQSLGQPAVQYDLSTTAGFSGPTEVCFPYDPARFSNPATLRLVHYENNTWVDRTSSHDLAAHIICARVSSFSPFAVVEFTNRAPVAAAGDDRTVQATGVSGARVTLDASRSTDPDGDALTYRWSTKGGGAPGSVASVTLPAGLHEVTLTVTDRFGATATDRIVITVTDSAVQREVFGEGALAVGGTQYLFGFLVREDAEQGVSGQFVLKAVGSPQPGLPPVTLMRGAGTVTTAVFGAGAPGQSSGESTFEGPASWNGAGGYRFRVVASDGSLIGATTDTVRIVVEDAAGTPIIDASGTLPGSAVRASMKAGR